MGYEISGLDLLLLSLCVTAYATAATAWTYFMAPSREREGVASGTAGAEFFDPSDKDPLS